MAAISFCIFSLIDFCIAVRAQREVRLDRAYMGLKMSITVDLPERCQDFVDSLMAAYKRMRPLNVHAWTVWTLNVFHADM